MQRLKATLWALLLALAVAPIQSAYAGDIVPPGDFLILDDPIFVATDDPKVTLEVTLDDPFLTVDEFGNIEQFFLSGVDQKGNPVDVDVIGTIVGNEVTGFAFQSDVEGDPFTLPSGDVEFQGGPDPDPLTTPFLVTSGRGTGRVIFVDEFGDVLADENLDTGAEGAINEAGTRFTAVPGSGIPSGNIVEINNAAAEDFAELASLLSDALDAWDARFQGGRIGPANGEAGAALRAAIDLAVGIREEVDFSEDDGTLTRTEARDLRNHLNRIINNARKIVFAPRFGRVTVKQVRVLIVEALNQAIAGVRRANQIDLQ